MASENVVQEFVHRLEEGGWAKWIRFSLLLAGVLFVYAVLIFDLFEYRPFRGLFHSEAMEQATIARELARGNGFTTKLVRPAALWQFKENRGALPVDRVPDTYHAPLNPMVNAPFLWLVKSSWDMTTKDIVYRGDRVVAGVAMGLFLLSVVVNYFTAKRLFDRKLALLAMGLLLVCDRFWQFSLSGLPQMLMLLNFSGCTYALVRAVEARSEGRSPLWWIIATGFCFGLLALTHALTLWIFGGALAFVLIYFPTRWREGAILIGIVSLMYAPWMARNYRVSGSAFGVAPYTGLYQIRGTEGQIMRSMVLSFEDINPTTFRNKVQSQILGMSASIYEYLGQSFVAGTFLLALLHLFKLPHTSAFRWCTALMLGGAVLGMAVFGLKGEGLKANDLFILFIPMLTCYGLAFILVLWSRLDITVRLIRLAFLTLIYAICAFPFFVRMTGQKSSRVQWPPYVPPFISILADWTTDQEIIMSDMPWAVGWYADRKSLWLPMTIADFVALNDYNELGGRIVGLYLTPVTGNDAFISGIVKGEYKEWAPFIIRNVNVKEFPLRAVTALPIDNECIFYADRDRWTEAGD